MKKLFYFVVVTLLCIHAANAQTTIPFQGVARDSNGVLIPNQAMSVRISIHTGSATGSVVYQEIQSVTTNSLGLFTLNIGASSATVLSGTFSGISWSIGAKFIQIEVDPTGGTNYINLGTSQFQTVPYALYAFNGGGNVTSSPTHVLYGGNGGVVSDNNFTRDSLTQHTQIKCSPPGSNYLSYFNVDSTRAAMGLFDGNTGFINLLIAGHGAEFGFAPNTVVAATIDGNNNIMHGFYALTDSTEMLTTALDSNGNFASNTYYGLVGTQAYSAYLDIMYNNGTSLNSLTADSAGLHWQYNNTNQYTLPLTDGTSGQVLTTNGAGVLTFTNLPTTTAFNAHQLLTGTGSTTDTITIQNNKNNIYNPASPTSALLINLPGSPNDGDMFILTFESAVSTITYNTGAVGNGALNSATISQQKTYTYDSATAKWY